MAMVKCRTCLKLSNKDDCEDIQAKCYLEQTIKQTIVYLVPDMVLTMHEGNVVCKKCLRTLKMCVQFIKTCKTVETILAHNKKLFDIPLQGTYISEPIVQLETIENILIKIDSDHNYYKKEEITESLSLSNKEDGEDKPDTKNIALDALLIQSNELCASRSNDSSTTPLQNLYIKPFIVNSDYDEGILEVPGSSDNSNTDAVEIKVYDNDIKENCSFVCSICTKECFDGDTYESHLETHVPACHLCGKTFSGKAAYRSHVCRHKEDFVKVCEFCGKTLKGAKSLRMHIAAMHEAPAPHICDRCPKSFKHRYKVNLHVKEVHERARQSQCAVCGKIFVNSERCKSHYKLVHLKLKPYVCSICGNKYGRKDYLDKHRAEHFALKKNSEGRKRLPKHGIRLKDPGKPVICRICNREMPSVHILKAHLESHVKIKRYKCKYCALTFSISNNRKRHEKLHENDSENKFRCNICWKRMKTEEELEMHVNSHDKMPQYSCETCGEKFHRKYLLGNHVAEKHTSQEDIEKAIEEIVVKNLLEYIDLKSK